MTTYFKKEDYKDTWPFADGDEVEVNNLKGSLVADIGGVYYSMNGLAHMIYNLPDVNIIEGKSVGPFIQKAKRNI